MITPRYLPIAFGTGCGSGRPSRSSAALQFRNCHGLCRVLKQPISGWVPCVELFGVRVASCCFMRGRRFCFALPAASIGHGSSGRTAIGDVRRSTSTATAGLVGCAVICAANPNSNATAIASGCRERWRRKHEADLGQVVERVAGAMLAILIAGKRRSSDFVARKDRGGEG